MPPRPGPSTKNAGMWPWPPWRRWASPAAQPDATFYLWCHVPQGETSAGFVSRVLGNTGVVAHPGQRLRRAGGGLFPPRPDGRTRRAWRRPCQASPRHVTAYGPGGQPGRRVAALDAACAVFGDCRIWSFRPCPGTCHAAPGQDRSALVSQPGGGIGPGCVLDSGGPSSRPSRRRNGHGTAFGRGEGTFRPQGDRPGPASFRRRRPRYAVSDPAPSAHAPPGLRAGAAREMAPDLVFPDGEGVDAALAKIAFKIQGNTIFQDC